MAQQVNLCSKNSLQLQLGDDKSMKIICDNQAALNIASNPVFDRRTKDIETVHHFIREKVLSREIIGFVNSNDQLEDIFNKSLKGPGVKFICSQFGHRKVLE